MILPKHSPSTFPWTRDSAILAEARLPKNAPERREWCDWAIKFCDDNGYTIARSCRIKLEAGETEIQRVSGLVRRVRKMLRDAGLVAKVGNGDPAPEESKEATPAPGESQAESGADSGTPAPPEAPEDPIEAMESSPAPEPEPEPRPTKKRRVLTKEERLAKLQKTLA